MMHFKTLYIDMDSFFASIEQQLDPSIRNQPVAITAINNEKMTVFLPMLINFDSET